MKLYELLKADLKRFGSKRTDSLLIGSYRLFSSASYKTTFWFRIGSYCRNSNSKLLRWMLYPFIQIYYNHISYLTGIQLPLGTRVGGGIMFSHFSGIIINKESEIGKNCTIYHGVTIGVENTKTGAPVIGDNCVISAGAKIIGPIKMGANVMIGANSVVVKDVPDNAVVVGIPGKIISYDGKKYVDAHFIK